MVAAYSYVIAAEKLEKSYPHFPIYNPAASMDGWHSALRVAARFFYTTTINTRQKCLNAASKQHCGISIALACR